MNIYIHNWPLQLLSQDYDLTSYIDIVTKMEMMFLKREIKTSKTKIIDINLIYLSRYYTTVPRLYIYIDTPAQSANINPIENLWVQIKKMVEKRSPTNKNEFIRFIKEEWEKIPSKTNAETNKR